MNKYIYKVRFVTLNFFMGAVAYRKQPLQKPLFFIYLRTELNYLSNDIILCGFVVVVYTLYRWTSQI